MVESFIVFWKFSKEEARREFCQNIATESELSLTPSALQDKMEHILHILESAVSSLLIFQRLAKCKMKCWSTYPRESFIEIPQFIESLEEKTKPLIFEQIVFEDLSALALTGIPIRLNLENQ